MAYLLTDGIYPEWAVFVKPLPGAYTNQTEHYNTLQSAARKDVERAFGVLQARWHIIAAPCRLWSSMAMVDVMRACITMHNMIIESERDVEGLDDYFSPADSHRRAVAPATTVRDRGHGAPPSLATTICLEAQMRNAERHSPLRQDLVKHLWEIKGMGL